MAKRKPKGASDGTQKKKAKPAETVAEPVQGAATTAVSPAGEPAVPEPTPVPAEPNTNDRDGANNDAGGSQTAVPVKGNDDGQKTQAPGEGDQDAATQGLGDPEGQAAADDGVATDPAGATGGGPTAGTDPSGNLEDHGLADQVGKAEAVTETLSDIASYFGTSDQPVTPKTLARIASYCAGMAAAHCGVGAADVPQEYELESDVLANFLDRWPDEKTAVLLVELCRHKRMPQRPVAPLDTLLLETFRAVYLNGKAYLAALEAPEEADDGGPLFAGARTDETSLEKLDDPLARRDPAEPA